MGETPVPTDPVRPQPPIKPVLPRSGKKWLWWTLIILIVIGLGVWWMVRPKPTATPDTTTNTTTPTSTVSNTTATSTDPTAGWETYTNTTYGYSIKHPSSLNAKDWVTTIVSGAAAEPNKDLLSIVGFGANKDSTDYEVSITVTNDTLQRRRDLAAYEVNVGSETEILIGGVKAYERTGTGTGPTDMAPDVKQPKGGKIISIVFQQGLYVYQIIYLQSDLAKDTSTLFNQMISTMTFAQPTTITLNELKSATYSTQTVSFALNDGTANVSAITGSDPETWTIDAEHVAYGDLSGDLESAPNTPNAAVIVKMNTGGTGTWSNLFLMGRKDGKVQSLRDFEFSDRTKIDSVSIANNQVTVTHRDWISGDYGPVKTDHYDLNLNGSSR